MTEPIALPNPANLSFVEDLYQAFLRDPAAVDARWREYFERLDGVKGARAGWRRGPSFRPRSLFDSARALALTAASGDGSTLKCGKTAPWS
jgi:2-oxoglutarate dehydrogenase complex dehydrogenase (E1) component-like enzyme